MAEGRSSKKVANGLVAASCGAVLAVYSAGYVRTRAAVDQFEAQAAERRAADPAPAQIVARVEGPRTAMRDTPATEPLPRPAPVAASDPSPIASPEPPPTPPVAATPVVPDSAPEPLVADTPAPLVRSAPAWKDGTYLGWGTSRHGDIQAEVVVEGGRIAAATIAQCRTRYSCSVIEKLPPEVALRQSPDVDYVSGATQSANAFYFAVVDALSRAK